MSTDIFIRFVMKQKMLDLETERRLLIRWFNNRDEEAMHQLVIAYLKLALKMAMGFKYSGVSKSDLIQQATVGMLKAAKKFDPKHGVRFSTYASWWIRSALQELVMENFSLVQVGKSQPQKKLFLHFRHVRARLEQEAERDGVMLSDHEMCHKIAAALNVSYKDADIAMTRLSNGDVSLNTPRSNSGEEDGGEWIDALEDKATSPTEETVTISHDRKCLSDWLFAGLQELPDREQYIVTERRLLDKPRTLESIGLELGISKERVRQLEVKAFGRLRKYLDRHHPEAKALLDA